MTIDPVMLSVANNMFHSIANEMGTVMLLSANSSIAREAKDTSTCLLDPDGRVVAQSIMIPMHMNSLAMAVRGWKERFDLANTEEDDVYVMNHPYFYGQHLNDIIIIMPVFADGALCGFTGSICHHVDVGGAAVMNAHATELFQEGFIIPPVKVKQADAFNGGVLERIIEANVRVPGVVVGDYRAQFFACRRGQELLRGMVGRYGRDVVVGCMQELQDYAERLMRATILKILDGTYFGEDFCDSLTPEGQQIPIRAKISIQGDRASVDLSESSDQVKGPINSPIASTYSAVYTFFVSMVRSGTIINDGSYRPIEIVTRKGSICDPVYPAPVRTRMTTSYRTFSACRKAMAEAVPDLVPASGHDSTTSVAFARRQVGSYHVYQEIIAGGLGASKHGDGCDGIAQPLSNSGNIPVEVMEVEADYLRVRSYGLITGSGGAGVHRGGMGIRKVFEVIGDGVSFSSTGDRTQRAPAGSDGGGDGRLAGVIMERGGEQTRLGGHNTMAAKPGDVFTIETAGGGGWGDASAG
ncbi:hydantoinase B/oxoprolinase family protein [Phenylobacterium sp.]|jgi:N-methylhydantoinase B|uniref:hydantoinase B/oxoprolinase family protein n=1 Tax=Phenylobacterium sp. TaxID=1871053 RepID=UPI003784C7BE